MRSLDKIVKRGVTLARHTTFGIGGAAAFFAEPESPEEVREVLTFSESEGLPVFILGGGSDVLFSDETFEGIVLRPKGFRTVSIKGHHVEAETGVALPKLVKMAAEESLSGFENFSGIPGRLGGAVAKNAGSWGKEIRDVLASAQVMTWEGELLDLSVSELGLSYRGSKLSELGVLLKARFELKHGQRGHIEKVMKEYEEKRSKTQPQSARTAGCIFKNPENMKAGYLLDKAGLKELTIGGAKYSEIHANFIVNENEASAKDVLDLIQIGKERVKEQFGVDLEEEIVIVRPE
jgi:UDP-N-acetylmuramate dehydrogenase